MSCFYIQKLKEGLAIIADPTVLLFIAAQAYTAPHQA